MDVIKRSIPYAPRRVSIKDLDGVPKKPSKKKTGLLPHGQILHRGSRKPSRREARNKSSVKPPLPEKPREEIVWAVANVSLLRSYDQVGKDDEVYQRLLDEVEQNIRYKEYFREERCLIHDEGIAFLKRHFYRRLQIIVSFLHALCTRKVKENKLIISVPISLYIEVSLRRTSEKDKNPGAVTVVPFSVTFEALADHLALMRDDEDLLYARFVLKLKINPSRASRVSQTMTDEEEVEKDKDEPAIVREIKIYKGDIERLFSKDRHDMAHVAVILLKSVKEREGLGRRQSIAETPEISREVPIKS
ncbi:hypothetical protein RvY_00797 [Ramazzottius varieornatus]|uniref:Uncharacterized protein n=1 Tax=Ramazzottius varieornatus TaxID=947166 RepID=A0A1D1UI12_RAMVA|nr:hypothetical protein RvY_00797 [Ramazzottius varieornatus]